jgi:hypothetical protein
MTKRTKTITREYETRPAWAAQFQEAACALQRLAEVADPLTRTEFIDLVSALASDLWLMDCSTSAICCDAHGGNKPDWSFPVKVERQDDTADQAPRWLATYRCHYCKHTWQYWYSGDASWSA